MLERWISTLWVLLFAVEAMAERATISDCFDWLDTSIGNVVEPWDQNTVALPNHVRITLIDTTEPACCAYHIAILAPDEDAPLGERQCIAVSGPDRQGFTEVDFKSLKWQFNTRQSFDLSFRYKAFDPDTGGGGRWQRATETISFAAESAAKSGRGAPPAPRELTGGDRTIEARLLGSWLPLPDPDGTGRRDLYTFNPDGTRAISDGSGMNISDRWALRDGRLSFDGRDIEFGFDGDYLTLFGQGYERFTLHGETYTGQRLARGVDPYGSFQPISGQETEIKVDDYSLHYIYLEAPDGFADWQSGETQNAPILVEFWNDKEPIKRAETGNAYRDDTINFSPNVWEITARGIKFYGTHPAWGEIFFIGDFDSRSAGLEVASRGDMASDKPIIRGDLMVKGYIFRDVQLYNHPLH